MAVWPRGHCQFIFVLIRQISCLMIKKVKQLVDRVEFSFLTWLPDAMNRQLMIQRQNCLTGQNCTHTHTHGWKALGGWAGSDNTTFRPLTEGCTLAVYSFILMCRKNMGTSCTWETSALPEGISMKCSTIYHHHCPTALPPTSLSSPLAMSGPQILKRTTEKGKIIFTSVFVKEEKCSLCDGFMSII